MWNGTHTKACNLNGYEFCDVPYRICLSRTLFGFPVLWWSCHNRSYILQLCSNPPVFCTWHLYSSWLATWHPYYCSPGEFHWLPWILMSRFRSLERVDFPVTAQSSAAVAWISSRPSRASSFQAPCEPLEFSLCKLVSAFILFILVPFLVFPLFIYVYLLYSRICASVI